MNHFVSPLYKIFKIKLVFIILLFIIGCNRNSQIDDLDVPFPVNPDDGVENPNDPDEPDDNEETKDSIYLENPSPQIDSAIVWNVKKVYGDINSSTLQKAINDAIAYRNSNISKTIVLFLDKGKYYLDKQIEISGLQEDGSGWIILRGTGCNDTELVDTEYNMDTTNTFEFTTPYRFMITDIRLTGNQITASQGTLLAINKIDDCVYLDVDIDEGYPNIDNLYEINTTKANKLRVFEIDPGNEVYHFIEGPNNDHYYYRWAFEGDIDDKGRINQRPILIDKEKDIWRFKLTDSDIRTRVFPYKVGDRLGISSKSNRSEWARFKNGGRDFIAKNISLLRLGRCKFRGGEWWNITFDNVKILRPQVNGKYSLYSTDAGPQFGHDEEDFYINNLVVKNCDFRGTIDDGSAFQKVKSGYAINNRWEDGGGVLVGPNTSKDFIFYNNTHIHCPLEDERE